MPLQTIDRGTPGNPSDTFKVGEAFDTCQANDQYLDLTKAGTISSWAAISAVAPTAASQLFNLAQHTSSGLGGGTLMAFVGSVTDDGGTKKNALGGFYLKRLDIENLSIEDFGGNGNGVFDNISVFGLIGASGYKRILIPDGKIFYTSGNFGALENIDYWGEGRVYTPTDAFPGKFAIATVNPTTIGTGLPNYFKGDSPWNSNQEYFIQRDVGRTLIDSLYFCAERNPKFSIFDNRAGASGTDAQLAADCNVGATSCTLKFTNVDFPTGTVFVMDDGAGHVQTFTSTGLTGGTVVNFTPPVSGSNYVWNTPFVTVKKASRTSTAYHQIEMYHNGGGDGYGHVYRINNGYTPSSTAQFHFFQTSTCGMYGGNVGASTDGVYLQISETTINDNGHDVAAIGFVNTYDRSVNTANRYAIWADRFVKSEGSKNLDFGTIYVGKFNVVHDFGGVTGTDCMIGFAPTQKIYFNNGQTIIPGNIFPIGYNAKGNMFMGSDGTGTVWELTNNSFKLKFSSSGALLAPGYVSVGSTISVPVNNKISLNSTDDLTFFRYDGANVKLYKNNVVVATW